MFCMKIEQGNDGWKGLLECINMQPQLYRIQNALRHLVISAKSDQRQIWSTKGLVLKLTSYQKWQSLVLMLLLLAFVTTYFATSLKSYMALHNRRAQKIPPIMPYWLPFFGNLLPFLRNPAAYCSQVV